MVSYKALNTVVNSAQLGTLSGFEDFRSSALTTFFSSMAEFIFMIVGAYFYGVMGALLGYGVGYVVVTALYFVFIRRNMLHYGICMVTSSSSKGYYCII